MEIEHKYPVGTTVKGIVRNLADYGAFVQIEEGIDALLHVSDISWTQKVNHPSEVLEKGQEIDVKILSIDPAHEKISVGLKQLQEDPWETLMGEITVGTDVEVEIAKLVSFGAFAKLEGGVEGLIHVSEIGEDVQKPEDALKIGDKVKARVISIDPVERKIGLSIRAYQQGEDTKLQEQYGTSGEEEGSVSVREAVGEAVPSSMLSAGGTLADAANEMMAAVKGGEKQEGEAPAEKKEEAQAESDEEKQVQSVESEAAGEEVVEPSDQADAPEKSESDS